MANPSERLSVLSDTERFALYGLPDFDDGQQLEYLSLSPKELGLASSRSGLHAQVYCTLQIGYFKAKQAFFRFNWVEVKEDCAFILTRYFNGRTFRRCSITKDERSSQRVLIASLFGYRLWSSGFLPQLAEQAAQIVRRDVMPGFVASDLVTWLNGHRIVRPGYTTLQTLISEALSAERKRLGDLLAQRLDDATQHGLEQLLVRDETLSELAALKQDAKDFGWRQMVKEREKRTTLEQPYRVAKALLPKLEISQQNLRHYANLANFYTAFDLRCRIQPEQTRLYLLCYVWQRYRQLTDNLVDALSYHTKRLEDESKALADKTFTKEQVRRQEEAPQVGRLILLYVDETLTDVTPFGDVRQQAFQIMPKDALQLAGQRMSVKLVSNLALRWQVVDGLAARVRRHLRPIFAVLDFASGVPNNPWLQALAWVRGVFAKQQRLTQRPLVECPEKTLPKRLRSYLLTFDADGKPTGVQGDRYEFWLYRQIRKRLQSGELYLDDSLQHRCFTDELVSLAEQEEILSQMDIPWMRQPIEAQLEALASELREQWLAFDHELRQGTLKHLDYDPKTQKLTCRRPKADGAVCEEAFYEQLASHDVADVLRFVNEQCQFLQALTPLQPRYAKRVADADSLMAVVIAQAMNHGNVVMARTSDIPYHVLNAAYQQYLRLASLQAANARISNAIAGLPIFPHYSFNLNALYGSVDGQKFGVEHPTVKARYSRKYFGRGKGVVAYTLLCNHVPLQGWIIGAHEFEAHYVFDIWYRNTSDIVPTVITGDMHSVNKANFAILHGFGPRFEPRFTNLDKQLKDLACADDPALYENCLVRPVGCIDRQIIVDEKANIDRIFATLALKELTQSTLIRKLCTYTQPNPTRRAIFEFDRLIRSIYTLRYLRDPQLQRNVHRSQNRIESYHQLRSIIAQVGGKKELTGKTDLELEISNQCARLVANAIVYYNSAILSRLLVTCNAGQHTKVLKLIKNMSPAAWRHILLNGHYTFHGSGQAIDLDVVLAGLDLADDTTEDSNR